MATGGTFRNPINSRADPTMVHYGDAYYLATTSGDRVRIWSAPSVTGLPGAEPVDVWVAPHPTDRSPLVWAPALWRLDGPNGSRWYIYFTWSETGVDNDHRMYVLESTGDDPIGPYTFLGRLADYGTYAIDGEPFVHDGQLYFTWSAPGRGHARGPNQIYAAVMTNPWTTTGDPIALPVEGGGCTEVREGPTFLYRNGRTFLTYSTCDTGKPDYQLWMISIGAGADPMIAGNWTQHPGPVFARNDDAGVFGPGHHFFFRSPDGSEDWIAYHGKNTVEYDYHWRTARIQPFTWNADGTPSFGSPLSLDEPIPLPAGDPGPGTQTINDATIGAEPNSVSYVGDWSTDTDCAYQCFGGDEHWSGNPGDTATFHFSGSRIALYSARDAGHGIAAISVDDGPETPVDLYGTPRVGQQLNYVSPPLTPGPHTLTVRVTGQRNDASSGTVISVDRADVW